MKIDRMLGIIALLQKRGRMTAPQLAEVFEVSPRTISRDIDAICRAGIPVATGQGRGGSISLMPGYAIAEGLVSQQELRDMLAGLKGIDSVSAAPNAQRVAQRLGIGPADEQDVRIDQASFCRDDLTEKIAAIRKAIAQGRPAGAPDRALPDCVLLAGLVCTGLLHTAAGFPPVQAAQALAAADHPGAL